MASQNRPRNLKWKELAHCFTCLERKSGFCRPLSTHCFSIYRHQGRQDGTYQFDLDVICSDFILNQPTLGRKVNTDLGNVRQNSSIVVTLGFVNKKTEISQVSSLTAFLQSWLSYCTSIFCVFIQFPAFWPNDVIIGRKLSEWQPRQICMCHPGDPDYNKKSHTN